MGFTKHAPGFVPLTVQNLTKREREVLRLICDQYTSAEIADKLHLNLRTIQGHRMRLLQKIGARNTAGLVVFAFSKGLVKIAPEVLTTNDPT